MGETNVFVFLLLEPDCCYSNPMAWVTAEKESQKHR